MALHARAERGREHMTQTAHYEQQCKTSWKKSLHLFGCGHYHIFSSICEPHLSLGLIANQAYSLDVQFEALSTFQKE